MAKPALETSPYELDSGDSEWGNPIREPPNYELGEGQL